MCLAARIPLQPVDEHHVLVTATPPDAHHSTVEPLLAIALPHPASSHEGTVRQIALLAARRHLERVEAPLPQGGNGVVVVGGYHG